MAQDIKFNKNIKSENLILEHWWVEEGEIIRHDQQIASVRDGNQIYLIKAPFEGILFKKYKQNNESFNKNEPLGQIISKEEAGNIKVTGKLGSTERKIIDSIHKEEGQVKNRVYVKASPSARRRAQQKNVNLEFVTGTGPGGRIQLRDVNKYVEEHETPTVISSYKNKTVKYGLPLTGLARRLAKKYNLDTSKIPAPPDVHRIRRKDVERYLKNPEGAVAEIELEYNIHQTSDLENPVIIHENYLPQSLEVKEVKKEEPSVIRLGTEEPNEIPLSDKVISLETEEPPLTLDSQTTEFFLKEPENEPEVTVIRLGTEKENEIPGGEPINLEAEILSNLLLDLPIVLGLKEPEENDGSVIRLYTTEESTIPSGDVLTLSGEDRKLIQAQVKPKKQEETEQKVKIDIKEEPEKQIIETKAEPKESVSEGISVNLLADLEQDILDLLAKYTKKQDKEHKKLSNTLNFLSGEIDQLKEETDNIAQLSTLVNLNLIDLVKKYNPPAKEIGAFLKNYILSVIYQVFNEEFDYLDNIYYIADIQNHNMSSFNSSELTEIAKSIPENYNKQKIEDIKEGECIVVELLGYNLSSVSGLIDPKRRIVLYLTYSKGLDRFFYENINIRSILKLTLEFDKEYLDPGYALKLIEALRTQLEG